MRRLAARFRGWLRPAPIPVAMPTADPKRLAGPFGDPWLRSKFKTDWACGLQQLRKVHRRVNQVAEAAYRNGQRHVANDDDAVYVDSPTTVNHYHPAPRRARWPWAALAVILWLGSLAALWLVLSRPAPAPSPVPQPQPQPQPQPAPGNGYDVSIYEP